MLIGKERWTSKPIPYWKPRRHRTLSKCRTYLGDGVVGNLVGVFADLVDASLHGLCWPAEYMACDWSVSDIQASDWSQLTYQLLLVQPGEGGRQLDGRRGEGGGQPVHQRGGGLGARACYWSIY